MPIHKLDHVNVRTTQVETMALWYSEVLGLRRGERPAFPDAGAWMYAGETAHVHLVEIEGQPGVGAEVALKLEHFAFSATGLDAFEKKLHALDVTYKRNEVSVLNQVQINVWDPDGNHIHVDFPADE